MIVIVVAKLAERHYEGRVRNGTGKRSSRITGIPIITGNSPHNVAETAKRYLKPPLVRRHRGVRIEVREDPELYGANPIQHEA